jgi:peptide/nickel transport system permease protein
MTQSLSADEVVVAEPVAVSRGRDIAEARQGRLVWYAFRRHRLAVAGLIVLIVTYLTVIFAEFLAPFDARKFDAEYAYAPPQLIRIGGDRGTEEGLGLYVHGLKGTRDPKTLAVSYVSDPQTRIPIQLFAQGDSYKLFGIIPADRHLIGPVNQEQPMYLLGADRTGRDLFSRIIYGTRISMTIGLIGVALAFVLGVILGGISGYLAGRTDTVIQRVLEFFMSLPSLPLWLGLAAALPDDWGPVSRYFAITAILAIVGWTDLARITRGRFLSLREEEFITAARLDGNSRPRMIFRHMLPSLTSQLIASLTLSVPGMILAETSLSFLGLGLQAPAVSWGVLLQDAQNIRVVATAPWLMLPGVAVVIAVLALNFVGDGLRDAADPYRH